MIIKVHICYQNSNTERHGEYDLIVTVSGVVRSHEDLARGEDASSAQIPLNSSIKLIKLFQWHHNSVCIRVTLSKVSNLLVCHYQCDHQENPEAKCQPQEIHYSLFRLQGTTWI